MNFTGMLKDGTLEGRTILITGGGTGLGKSMGKYFMELGANLIITSRKQEVLDNTYSIIQDFYSSDLDDKFKLQDELLDFFHNIETGMFNYSTWTEDIGLIITAILNQEFIQYKYRSAKATEYKNHKVFPVKMIYNSGTLYLYVYNLDEERDRDYFMITLHRIEPGTVEVHKISEIEEYLKTKIKRYHEKKLVFKQSIPDKDLEKR